MSEPTPVLVMDPKRLWGLVVLRGVMALLFGLFALAWPGITVLAVALLFGIYALADGIGLLMDGFRSQDRSSRGMRILGGVLGILIGLAAIVWPGLTIVAVGILIGAWALATGIAEIVSAIRLRKQIEGELMLGLAGAVSVIFGLLMLLWPALGLAAITSIVGVFALIYGVVLIFLGVRLRSLARS
jgi:uncharacterized membrane protein HdeD (DUF308 family)